MGKFDLPLSSAENTGIAIKPVLLRKGSTHLGLYGVGNVKDQRMHFELRSNRVRMYMPRNKDEWFNVLLLHQNRCDVYSNLTLLCNVLITLFSPPIVYDMVPRSQFLRACLMTAWTLWFGVTNTIAGLYQSLLLGSHTTSRNPDLRWLLPLLMGSQLKSE
jgi:hypothetical protein